MVFQGLFEPAGLQVCRLDRRADLGGRGVYPAQVFNPIDQPQRSRIRVPGIRRSGPVVFYPVLNQADAGCRVQGIGGMEIVEVVQVISPQAVYIARIPLYAFAAIYRLIQKAEVIVRCRR